MKNLYKLFVLVGIGLFAMNFSEQSSIRKERPDINVAGTITTQAGTTMPAQNITISGKWERIHVYSKPENKMDPEKYAVSFDLDELKEVRINGIDQSLFKYQPPDKIEKREDGTIQKKCQNPIDYIEFQAIYKGHEQNPARTYLIERSKKVWFDEMVGSNRVEHRPNIEAIKRIVIERITSNKDEEKDECIYKPRHVRAKEISKQEKVYKKLKLLETTTEKLPVQTTTTDLNYWKEKFGELLQELRDSMSNVFKQ